MKNLLLTLYFILTILISTKCDTIVDENQNIEYDNISDKEIVISGIRLNQYIENLNLIGKVDSIVSFEDEMQNNSIKRVYYGKSYIEISNSKMIGFYINDNTLKLNDSLTTGIKMSNLKEIFPLSFDNIYEAGGSLILKVKINNSDTYLLFKGSDKLITDIFIWNDL